jgi:hypothetical protein
MPNYNPKTEHLESTKHKAEDTHGKTQTLGVRLDPSDVEALKQLPGGVSANIRKAIKKYLENFQKNP